MMLVTWRTKPSWVTTRGGGGGRFVSTSEGMTALVSDAAAGVLVSDAAMAGALVSTAAGSGRFVVVSVTIGPVAGTVSVVVATVLTGGAAGASCFKYMAATKA